MLKFVNENAALALIVASSMFSLVVATAAAAAVASLTIIIIYFHYNLYDSECVCTRSMCLPRARTFTIIFFFCIHLLLFSL